MCIWYLGCGSEEAYRAYLLKNQPFGLVELFKYLLEMMFILVDKLNVPKKAPFNLHKFPMMLMAGTASNLAKNLDHVTQNNRKLLTVSFLKNHFVRENEH